MARRLPRWHWIRAVRQHGPRVASVRCVLFALAVRMDEAGEAFPSQATLAADTSLSERTVRDAVLVARSEGWLAVVEHFMSGQAWRHSYYIACVPDRLDLTRVDLGKSIDAGVTADHWAAQHGHVDDPMHEAPIGRGLDRARPRKPKGAAMASARSVPTSAEEPERCGRRPQKVRQLAQEGADVDRKKVRTPSPTKFPSEVPILSSQQEGHALKRATALGGTGNPEMESAATSDGSAPPAADPEVLRGKRKPKTPTAESGRKYIATLVQDGIPLPQAIEYARKARYPIQEIYPEGIP